MGLRVRDRRHEDFPTKMRSGIIPMTLIGWITLAGVILMVLSLFVAQAGERNKVLFNIANAMTLIGFLGLLIGLFSWLFG